MEIQDQLFSRAIGPVEKCDEADLVGLFLCLDQPSQVVAAGARP
jgi:hypothetical protein